MGLIGGGPGSFIGAVHRLAAEMDREIELVAGAFSTDPARSHEAGVGYRIDPARAYASWTEMITQERLRSDGVDFVVIATPNHLHLPAAIDALDAGLAVMSDKPMTATLSEARTLAAKAASAARPYRLSYTYSGYPLVREARRQVAEGRLGPVRKVVVEYSQGWLARPIEAEGVKQAGWRTEPAQAGAGCIGDIGVHAFHLAEFTAGRRVTRFCADLNTLVPGRKVDDDCNVLLRFDNGATGALIASQIAVGERNRLHLRIYGERAALEWRQEQPNTLAIRDLDGTETILHAGTALGSEAIAATRLPAGHPEGFLEAFANLYRDFARLLAGEDNGLLADASEGLRGMAFIDAAQVADGAWTDLEISA
jgi:predicted dehydrogenase